MTGHSLASRVIKTDLVSWKNFQFIQQEDFKDFNEEAKSTLRNSVLQNQFTQPFYVWHDEKNDIIYCLDGKHRTSILKLLETEGYDIPEKLPATFIHCENKKEAAELVLIYSSIYAKITHQGLFDFLQLYDIEYDSIKNVIDIPDFSFSRFEQKFDVFEVANAEDQTDRLCYATEIKPAYVQSQIIRYIKFCDKKGVEVNFSHLNGELTLKDFIHDPAESTI